MSGCVLCKCLFHQQYGFQNDHSHHHLLTVQISHPIHDIKINNNQRIQKSDYVSITEIHRVVHGHLFFPVAVHSNALLK